MPITEKPHFSYTKEALAVFALLAILYGYFYHEPGWNGNSRLALVFAVVQEGRLTIDSYHLKPGTDTGDKAVYEGHYYSDKAVGSSLLGAVAYFPFYNLSRAVGYRPPLWFQKYVVQLFALALPSAFAASLVFAACLGVSGSRRRAYVAAGAYALGTMAFPFSVIFFGHQLAAALLFSAFYLTLRLRYGGDFRRWHLFAVGLLLGLALITEFTTAVIVLPLVLYYFHTLWLRRRRSVAEETGQRIPGLLQTVGLPAVGGALPLALMLAYNYACFGSPFSLAYSHLENPLFREGMGEGLMGVHAPSLAVLYYITVHPAHGLFWQSPVLLASLVGLFLMLRRRGYRAEALVACASLAAMLFVNAGYYMWWGGWVFGPRHLIPALPFLALPLVFIRGRAFRLVTALGLVSAFQMFVVAATVVEVPDTLIREADKLAFFQYSSIYGFCFPRLLAGNLTHNLGRELFGLTGLLSLLPLLVVTATAAYAFTRKLRPHAGPPAQASRVDGGAPLTETSSGRS